jgi:hypothetical protein
LISPIKVLGLLAVALLLSGCATRSACVPGAYQEAVAPPPLAIPEGMDAPDRLDALRVPDSRSAPGRAAEGCVAEPPGFFVDSGEANPENLPIRPSSIEGAAPIPYAAPARTTRLVTRFIESWAKAWDRRDFDAWVKFYTDDFTPEGYEDNAAWRSEQQRLFEVDASTQIRSDTMQIVVLPEGKVRAQFTQEFGVGDRQRAVVKQLILTPRERGTGWLISEDYIIDVL